MKAFYVDSSILVAILFEEKTSALIRKELGRKELLSSYLLEAEVLSAAVREQLDLDFALSGVATVSRFWPERSLENEFRAVFASGYCRGADAHHLACALYLDPSKKNLRFVTADKKQAEIAKRLGLDLLFY